MIRSIALLLVVLFSIAASGSPGTRESVFSITQCVFDEDSLVFRLSWTSDSTALSAACYAGITASCIPDEQTPPITSFRRNSLVSDTTFSLSNLVFDTVYTISIWTMLGGKWILPDSLSMRSVRVTSGVKQPISYFPSSGKDTVKALAGKFLMWKTPGYHPISPYDDTVQVFAAPDSTLSGFLSFGIGVKFLKPPELSPSLFIGFACDSAALTGRLRQCRLYKDSSGVLLVQREAIIDTANRRIYLETGDFSFPYIVLADTVRPVIRILSDTSRTIESDDLTDSLTVADNSVNLRWLFYRAVGEEKLTAPAASGYIAGQSGRILCPIPATGAQEGGVRAFLILSDGAFIDTVLLSHRAIRLHSDATTTPENSVVPISLTAQPDNPDLPSCLGNLFSDAGGAYDRSKFRIFRWFPTVSNAQSADKWIEFTSAGGGAFDCRPGALFWLITQKSKVVDFGRSTTLSLKSSSSLRLSPHNWTDFSVPFGFNMALSAVLRASGPAAQDLVIYRWVPDAAKRTYRARLLFGSESLSGDSVADTLFSGSGSGYTAFNPLDTAVDLIFPPLPVSMKDQETSWGFRKKAGALHSNYCVKVSAFSHEAEISTAFCGVRNGGGDTILFPSPPTFSRGVLKVRRGDASGAIMLYPSSGNDIDLFPIEFINGEKEPQSVSLRPSLVKSGAHTTAFRLLEKTSGGYACISEGAEIKTEASGRIELLLAAGGPQAVESFIAGISGPALRQSPRISYQMENGRLRLSIPAAAHYRLSIFDIKGRCILQSETGDGGVRAENARMIVTEMPSGVYILSSAIRGGQKTVSETRLLMLPK